MAAGITAVAPAAGYQGVEDEDLPLQTFGYSDIDDMGRGPSPGPEDEGTPKAPSTPKGCEAARDRGLTILGPPNNVEPDTIYKLYRGVSGQLSDMKSSSSRMPRQGRVWAEFTALQLCWAEYDLPAKPSDRVSLLKLGLCELEELIVDEVETFRIHVYTQDSPPPGKPHLTVGNRHGELRDVARLKSFAEALMQLLQSVEDEGTIGLEFIQKRLFQYLWKHQGSQRNEKEHYEAQAVLAFNLNPKEGVAYLRSKSIIGTERGWEEELGEWLQKMSVDKGAFDPSLLGDFFSRKENLGVYTSFVHSASFGDLDILSALRRLFDTFKPGGEGQVISRILEEFAEAYLKQWQQCKDSNEPKVNYLSADSVFQVAISLIMLNTDVHVASKKIGKTKTSRPPMNFEQYVTSTRLCVKPDEIPDDALRLWFDGVQEQEISMEPLPRVAFSQLPVQPDIEGWLTLILGSRTVHERRVNRYWGVLALQRLYLFSDENEIEQVDAVDLKDAIVRCVSDEAGSRQRLEADLRGAGACRCPMFPGSSSSSVRAELAVELEDAEVRRFDRAFEIIQSGDKQTFLHKLTKDLPWARRTRLVLVTETADLCGKWVSLISSGAF